MTGLIAVTNVVVGKPAGRYGAWLPMLLGRSPAAVGLLLLLYVDSSPPAGVVAVLLVPMALGCALTVPPLAAAMMEAVPADRAGSADRAGPAAGVLNSARQVAGGPAIAAFGSSVSGGFESGMRVSLALSAVLLTATAAATLGLQSTG